METALPPSARLPEVYYNCGLLAGQLGKRADAVRDLTQYLTLAPTAKDAKRVRELIKQYQ